MEHGIHVRIWSRGPSTESCGTQVESGADVIKKNNSPISCVMNSKTHENVIDFVEGCWKIKENEDHRRFGWSSDMKLLSNSFKATLGRILVVVLGKIERQMIVYNYFSMFKDLRGVTLVSSCRCLGYLVFFKKGIILGVLKAASAWPIVMESFIMEITKGGELVTKPEAFWKEGMRSSG